MEGSIEQLSEPATPSATQSLAESQLTVLFDKLFLAMAYHHSQRPEDSKDMLDRVVKQLDTNEQNKNDPAKYLIMDAWQKRELQLLREEAERLIRPKR